MSKMQNEAKAARGRGGSLFRWDRFGPGLQLAMELVGGILYGLNEKAGGKLRWEGDESGDLGFPFPI